MFWKKKMKKPPASGKLEFDFVMAKRAAQAERYPEKQDQISFLDFIIQTIKRDLIAECRSSILYQPTAVEIVSLFPHAEGKFGETEIDLATADVLAIPWRMESLWNTLSFIRKDGFRFDSNHHMANYYPEIKLCHVFHGIHSVVSGIFHKTGSLHAEIAPLTPLFSYIRTDGERWYNSRSGGNYSVGDFRLAILYEAARTKYKLMNGDA